jgi:hypothetical protein
MMQRQEQFIYNRTFASSEGISLGGIMPVSKPVKVIVVPAKPPIDKFVAARRVLNDNTQYSVIIEFCDVNQPTPEHLARWQAMCSAGVEPYLVDIGDKKYHQLGSSAAEVELAASETRSSRILKHLVDLVNVNNKTGNLKNRRHAIAKLVRDAYHVMNMGSASQSVVFDHAMDVVDAYFMDHGRRAWDTLSNPEYAELKQLWDGFNVSEKEVTDFTLPLYFRHLFTSGRSTEEIIEKISWWNDKAKKIAARRAAVQNANYPVRQFKIQGRSAGLVRTSDYFEAEEAPYKLFGDKALGLSLLIIRDEQGHVHIKSSYRYPGINLDSLFEALNTAEPGLWYFEKRFKAGPMIMNGSRQFTGVPPSGLSDGDLCVAVHALVTFEKAQ